MDATMITGCHPARIVAHRRAHAAFRDDSSDSAPDTARDRSDAPPNGSGDLPRRILVVDDNPAIHQDFRKLLCPLPTSNSIVDLEASIFGSGLESEEGASIDSAEPPAQFQVDSALQGREGYEMVVEKARVGQPYALAFVDMRMPPGWDGVETIAHMLQKYPDLEVVICSAYSDYSWEEVIRKLNRPGLRLLKKPFDSKDVLELAWSLTSKWLRHQQETKSDEDKEGKK